MNKVFVNLVIYFFFILGMVCVLCVINYILRICNIHYNNRQITPVYEIIPPNYATDNPPNYATDNTPNYATDNPPNYATDNPPNYATDNPPNYATLEI